jgi:hypothetical protein
LVIDYYDDGDYYNGVYLLLTATMIEKKETKEKRKEKKQKEMKKR